MGVQELIAAFRDDPVGPDDAETLVELVAGVVGIIPDDATVTTGVLQVDPADSVSGAVRLAYVYLDGLFKYDATDETTAHDGVTCIVLIGGRRYLLVGNIRVKAVEAVGFDTDPTPTVYGQAWIDLTGSIGNANDFIIHTSRGWVTQAPDYGPPIYVKTASTDFSAKSYVHWDETDGWVSGFGPSQYQADTIPLSAEIWDGTVQNQTTNAQPTTIAVGIAHIIGPSPTGAKWAGNAGKISICEVADDVTVYTPWVGMTVFDIALNIDVKWNGTAWISAAGAFIGFSSIVTAEIGTESDRGSGNYTYTQTTAPLVTNRHTSDDKTLTYAARSSASKLIFRWQGMAPISSPAAGDKYFIALYRANASGTFESNALSWFLFACDASGLIPVSVEFIVDAPDAASHIYRVGLGPTGAVGGVVGQLSRKTFSVSEVP